MQKWSPEPFPIASQRKTPAADREWSATTDSSESRLAQLFRKDNPQGDRETLLDLMSNQEREQIYQLVEADIEAEYAQKYQDADAKQQAQFEAWLVDFSEAFRKENEAKIDLLTRQTAALAMALAEKVVRREVAMDQQVLVRTLETVLYKLDAGAALQLRVHPDDASFLENQKELLQRLNVTEIVPDRRIESGGCVVQANGQEWDATIQKQLGNLAEVVEDIFNGDITMEEVSRDDADPPLA